jgi:hypothetical protein
MIADPEALVVAEVTGHTPIAIWQTSQRIGCREWFGVVTQKLNDLWNVMDHRLANATFPVLDGGFFNLQELCNVCLEQVMPKPTVSEMLR